MKTYLRDKIVIGISRCTGKGLVSLFGTKYMVLGSYVRRYY